AVTAHHEGLLQATVEHELMVERASPVHPDAERVLAVYRTAVRLGCSWCVEFGSILHRHHGLDNDRLNQLYAYPTADLFSRQEKLALAYADAMTATPVEVTDAQVAELVEEFGHEGVVELTYHIALENMRARTNSALGIPAQGFAENCQLPAQN